MPDPIPVRREHLAKLLVCAARYALGRTSGIGSEIAALVRHHAAALSDVDREVLIRDIEAEFAYRARVPRIVWIPEDRRAWEELAAHLRSLG